MSILVPPTHLEKWINDNSASFVPPICNKLLHKGQLSIMLVGGPNQRKDFHSEEGTGASLNDFNQSPGTIDKLTFGPHQSSFSNLKAKWKL